MPRRALTSVTAVAGSVRSGGLEGLSERMQMGREAGLLLPPTGYRFSCHSSRPGHNFIFFFFFKDFIYLFMIERESERERCSLVIGRDTGRGRSRLHAPGA